MYNEPKHISEILDQLDDFSDLAKRTKVLQKGLFSEPLGFTIKREVHITDINELADCIEQESQLKYMMSKKLEFLSKDNEMLKAAILLVEIYLTASIYNGERADKAKRFALSNLNLI